MRNKIAQALDARFRADILNGLAKLEIYLDQPVGVGDHPDIVGEAAKLVNEIVTAQGNARYSQGLYDKDVDNGVDTDDLEETVKNLVDKMDKFLTALGGSEKQDEETVEK